MHKNTGQATASRLSLLRSMSGIVTVESLELRRLLAGTYAPDTSFGGGDGGLVFDLSSDFLNSGPTAVVSAADGSLFVAGRARNNANSAGAAAIVKVRPNGTVDTSFGGGDGMVSLSAPGYADSSFDAIDLAADGKIIAVGYDTFVLGQILVARFNADGTPDMTFSADGQQTYGASGPDKATSVKALSGGKILVGSGYDNSRTDMAMLRLNADGTPDTAFSGDGLAFVDFYAGNDRLNDFTILGDGSIVGVGSAFLSGRGAGPSIAKFTAAGAIDTNYASSGSSDLFATLGVGGFTSVVALPDGRVLAAGTAANVPIVARFTASGVLDTSFGGGDGWTTLAGTFDASNVQVLVEPDNAILLVATLDAPNPAFSKPVVARLSASGVLDTTFGNAGLLTLASPTTGGGSGTIDAILDAEGSLVVLGTDFGDAVLQRLTTAGPGVTATLSGGVVTVTGTDGNDAVTIRNDFAGQILVETAARAFSFPFNSVTSIAVGLGNGADSLTVRQVISKPITFVGGAGNDLVDVETSNGDDDDALLTHARILGGGNDVTFDASTETVSLRTLFGFDQIDIDLSQALGGLFTVDGGNGNDRFDLLAAVGNNATLLISDSADTDVLALGPATLDRVIVSTNRDRLKFSGSTGSAQLVGIESITGLNGPRVTSSGFQFETEQAVAFAFENLNLSSLDLTDLTLRNLDSGFFFRATTSNGGSSLFDQSTLFRDFAAIGVTTPITLPDGRYRATIPIGRVTDVLGTPNPTALSVDFHILAGDANRDRTVNFADLVILAQNYNQTGKTFSQGNFNYSTDGKVDFADLVLLAQRYNTSLAPAGVTALPLTTSNGSRIETTSRSRRAALTELA